ncbi:MAG: hypothetical protein QOJ59_1515 [Thermomicrobiales bacterium]|jgi:hypothetical protein|nr:hypothetical protein [Thermomicrobiales bacterium]
MVYSQTGALMHAFGEPDATLSRLVGCRSLAERASPNSDSATVALGYDSSATDDLTADDVVRVEKVGQQRGGRG